MEGGRKEKALLESESDSTCGNISAICGRAMTETLVERANKNVAHVRT